MLQEGLEVSESDFLVGVFLIGALQCMVSARPVGEARTSAPFDQSLHALQPRCGSYGAFGSITDLAVSGDRIAIAAGAMTLVEMKHAEKTPMHSM